MYIVDATADEPIITVNSHIGYDPEEGQGIDGKEWAKELMYLDSLGKKVIKVWMNCLGGSVVDGFDMYNAMMQTKAKVDTYNTGICASMGAVLFQAGRNRVMMDYSILMYHNPFGNDVSNDMVNAFKNSLVTMVSTRSGMDAKAVDDMMSATTYINANEAKLMKLCDEIQGSDEMNKKRAQAVFNKDAKAFYLAHTPILNSLLNKTNMPLIKVTNRLNINADATEESMVAAIDSIENRAKTAEGDIVLRDKTIGELRNSVTTVTGERDAAVTELAALKLEKTNAAAAAIKNDAKAFIAGAVKLGKIKNEAANIAEWEKAYEANPDSVKNMIGSIPVTVKAPQIVTEAKENADNANLITNSVAHDMLAVKNRLGIQ